MREFFRTHTETTSINRHGIHEESNAVVVVVYNDNVAQTSQSDDQAGAGQITKHLHRCVVRPTH